MPASFAYATAQEYRANTGKSDGGDDPLISRHLETVSRLIDSLTGQYFGRDEEAVARVFKAKWSDRLDLTYEGNCPGIADITDLAIKVDTDDDGDFADETAWSAGDYELLPRQALQGSEPKPYTRIETPRRSSKRFSPGALVEVTAIFGWPAVPEGIWAETIELCGIWRGENPRATGRMAELDEVVSTSPMAMSLVKRIREAYGSMVTF